MTLVLHKLPNMKYRDIFHTTFIYLKIYRKTKLIIRELFTINETRYENTLTFMQRCLVFTKTIKYIPKT